MKWTPIPLKTQTTKNSQEEIDNLNKPIDLFLKIESIISDFIKWKAAGPDGFTGEFQKQLRNK